MTKTAANSNELPKIYMNEKRGKDGNKAFITTDLISGREVSASKATDGELVFKLDGDVQDARLMEGRFGPYYLVKMDDNTFFASEGKSKHGPYVRIKLAPKREENADSDEGAGKSAPKSKYNS